jgi:dipeptide/tripeptide permease
MAVKRVVRRRRKKFPTIGVILLMIGIVWLLMSLGKIASFPWLAAILIIVGIGFIINNR